jgi:hypothetical protein
MCVGLAGVRHLASSEFTHRVFSLRNPHRHCPFSKLLYYSIYIYLLSRFHGKVYCLLFCCGKSSKQNAKFNLTIGNNQQKFCLKGALAMQCSCVCAVQTVGNELASILVSVVWLIARGPSVAMFGNIACRVQVGRFFKLAHSCECACWRGKIQNMHGTFLGCKRITSCFNQSNFIVNQ